MGTQGSICRSCGGVGHGTYSTIRRYQEPAAAPPSRAEVEKQVEAAVTAGDAEALGKAVGVLLDACGTLPAPEAAAALTGVSSVLPPVAAAPSPAAAAAGTVGFSESLARAVRRHERTPTRAGQTPAPLRIDHLLRQTPMGRGVLKERRT